MPRHSLASRYIQHRSMPRHSRTMGSSRARPVLLLDDEDLDIVMEENGNGRLTETTNPCFPFSDVVSAGEAGQAQNLLLSLQGPC
jgi:hypothetical protein